MQRWASAGTKRSRWRLKEPGPSRGSSVAYCFMWCVCVLINVKQLHSSSCIAGNMQQRIWGFEGVLDQRMKKWSVNLWCLIQGGNNSHLKSSNILAEFIIHTWLPAYESNMRFGCVFLCLYICMTVFLRDHSSISSVWETIKWSVYCGCALSTSRRHPS